MKPKRNVRERLSTRVFQTSHIIGGKASGKRDTGFAGTPDCSQTGHAAAAAN
jgi:hypothetical protein